RSVKPYAERSVPLGITSERKVRDDDNSGQVRGEVSARALSRRNRRDHRLFSLFRQSSECDAPLYRHWLHSYIDPDSWAIRFLSRRLPTERALVQPRSSDGTFP